MSRSKAFAATHRERATGTTFQVLFLAQHATRRDQLMVYRDEEGSVWAIGEREWLATFEMLPEVKAEAQRTPVHRAAMRKLREMRAL